MIAVGFAEFIAKIGFQLASPTISKYEARLCTNPAGSLTADSEHADLIEMTGDGYATIELDNWDVSDKRAETTGATEWENAGDDPWGAATYFAVSVYQSGLGDQRQLAWFHELSPEIVVAASEKIILPQWRFDLVSL